MNDYELERAASDLAHLFAKRRVNGAVFMDGAHLPVPSEHRDALEFLTELLRRGWTCPADQLNEAATS